MYKYLYKVWVVEKGKSRSTGILFVTDTTITSQIITLVKKYYDKEKYDIDDIKEVGIMDKDVMVGPIAKGMYPDMGILNTLVEPKALYPVTIMKSMSGECTHVMVVSKASSDLYHDRVAVESFIRSSMDIYMNDIVEVLVEHRVEVDPSSLPCIVGNDTVVNNRETVKSIFGDSM